MPQDIYNCYSYNLKPITHLILQSLQWQLLHLYRYHKIASYTNLCSYVLKEFFSTFSYMLIIVCSYCSYTLLNICYLPFLKCLKNLYIDKRLIFFTHHCSGNHQLGFIPSHSCLHQLLLYTHELVTATSDYHDIDVIYLDYHKAFNSVSHSKLLLKLWK